MAKLSSSSGKVFLKMKSKFDFAVEKLLFVWWLCGGKCLVAFITILLNDIYGTSFVIVLNEL